MYEFLLFSVRNSLWLLRKNWHLSNFFPVLVLMTHMWLVPDFLPVRSAQYGLPYSCVSYQIHLCHDFVISWLVTLRLHKMEFLSCFSCILSTNISASAHNHQHTPLCQTLLKQILILQRTSYYQLKCWFGVPMSLQLGCLGCSLWRWQPWRDWEGSMSRSFPMCCKMRRTL